MAVQRVILVAVSWLPEPRELECQGELWKVTMVRVFSRNHQYSDRCLMDSIVGWSGLVEALKNFDLVT